MIVELEIEGVVLKFIGDDGLLMFVVVLVVVFVVMLG
jgi:hypothetical protein